MVKRKSTSVKRKSTSGKKKSTSGKKKSGFLKNVLTGKYSAYQNIKARPKTYAAATLLGGLIGSAALHYKNKKDNERIKELNKQIDFRLGYKK